MNLPQLPEMKAHHPIAVSELIGRIHTGARRKDITPVTPAE